MAYAVLANVTTQNDYTMAATLELIGTERIIVQIANAAVFYQLDGSSDGRGVWSGERFLGRVIGTLDRKCSGIRFRSALAGAPAQVSAELLDRDEITGSADTLGAFPDFISASGGTGTTLSLETGDLFYSHKSADRGGALLCDGRALDAVADPTLENLWNTIGITYGGTGKSNFLLPDGRGRGLFGVGTNADVNAVGKSDGLAVGTRSPKHNTSINESPHAHPLSEFNTGNAYQVTGAGNGLDNAAPSGRTTGNASTGITAGPGGTRPTDLVPFLAANLFIVK